MNDRQRRAERTHEQAHHGRGGSSYWLHDPAVVFDALCLAPGETFLDIGCGPGDYAIRAAEIVRPFGRVYAVDVLPQIILPLVTRAQREGIGHLRAVTADITRGLAFDDNSVDVAFASTVLHCLELEKAGERIFEDVRRVLRPSGRLAVLECKKEELPFGPRLHMRLAPDDIRVVASRTGFQEVGYYDLGYGYLLLFVNARPLSRGKPAPSVT